MRVVFLGTPEFAVPSLNALLAESALSVVGVFTQPDRKAGRGQRFLAPPVKVVAEAHGVPILQPERIRNNPEAQAFLAELEPDVCVVVAFGQILPRGFFDLPRFGSVNVHASVLPAYRGAAPVAHSILNGDRESGVTIMKIDVGMDTGDLLSVKRLAVPETATTGEMETVLAEEGARLLIPTLLAYLRGAVQPVPQPAEGVSMAPKIRREDGALNWDLTVDEVLNRIRAMNPWPGAYSGWRSEEVKVWKAVRGAVGQSRPGVQPGTILLWDKAGIEVQCGSGTLRLLELQLPNRKRVSGAEFVNGTRARLGEQFQTNPLRVVLT